MPKVTFNKILKSIKWPWNWKTFRLDQILDEVVKLISQKICSYLEQIFNNLLILCHYLFSFKKSIIVILQKQKNIRDYTNLQNYRLISFINTISKIMEAILVIKIGYIATIYNFLFSLYFRGCQRLYTERSLHNLLKKIYLARNQGKIAIFLVMNIFEAYFNILHKRLLYNLQNHKIDIKVILWIASFFTNRNTFIKTNKLIILNFFIKLALSQNSTLL